MRHWCSGKRLVREGDARPCSLGLVRKYRCLECGTCWLATEIPGRRLEISTTEFAPAKSATEQGAGER